MKQNLNSNFDHDHLLDCVPKVHFNLLAKAYFEFIFQIQNFLKGIRQTCIVPVCCRV